MPIYLASLFVKKRCLTWQVSTVAVLMDGSLTLCEFVFHGESRLWPMGHQNTGNSKQNTANMITLVQGDGGGALCP